MKRPVHLQLTPHQADKLYLLLSHAAVAGFNDETQVWEQILKRLSEGLEEVDGKLEGMRR